MLVKTHICPSHSATSLLDPALLDGTSKSDVCASDVRIDREHPSPLHVAGVMVENGGLGWKAGIVVYNIVRVRTGRNVAFCSNDDSDGVADPFLRPLRELECIVGRIYIEVAANRYGPRKRCIDLDLKGSSRGHDGGE